MKNPCSITSDLFLIPWEDKYIIYAPLKRLAFLVSPGLVNILHKIKTGQDLCNFSEIEKEALKPLLEMGIINGVIEKITFRPEEGFIPTYVTLFLTTKCNLRCIYCYASGGEKGDVTLPMEVSKSAIDLIIRNTLLKNQKAIGLGFHGGGEPTLAWELLQGCVEYGRSQASEQGLKINLSIATNGIIVEEKLNWIMENFSSLNLSFDGPEEIQNYQRPMAKGGGSFHKIMETVRRLNDRKFPYGLRSTITDQSVRYMDKIVAFFGHNCEVKSIHLEPTFNCGRCLYTGTNSPCPDEFIEGFRKATYIAEELGISLFYSGARLHTITNSFCKASGESFCVTPRGDVTSCYEVCSKDDPRSDMFFFGKYDEKKGEFIFFEDKLAYLKRRTVSNIPFCEDCFCKYHCAGDCLAKASSGGDLTRINNDARCQINRTLTLDQILKILQPEKEASIHR